MSRRVARVLLDSPLPQLDRLFDYALPEEFGAVRPGVRVRVPLRSAGRIIDGFIIEIGEESDPQRTLSVVDTIVSEVEVVPERLFRLARRVADRAAGSASDVLRLAVPKRQVRAEKAWKPPGELVAVGPEERERAAGEVATCDGLAEALRDRARCAVEVVACADAAGRPRWPALLAAAAALTLAGGDSAIIVVPDHRDIDLVHDALSALVPASALVRHDSRQSNPDRYRSFLRTLEDAPCIVIGNRSAVYSPVRAGLVVIWDDGDPLLAEPLAPYVHARDAALVRQEQEGSALVLAAHTRSTDAERLVAHGWLHDVRAHRRYLPSVSLSTVDELAQPGIRVPPSAFRMLREALAQGPVLVQVARPGFAPTLLCGQCRRPARCDSCGGPLGATHRGAVPACRWCGKAAATWSCAHCQGGTFRLAAAGTERTAEELGRAFPGTQVIVSDSAHPVDSVGSASALVIATRGAEPPADGGYRGVLLLDGARMLQSPDLRVGESCLRWWAGAAALAAPGAQIHLVGVDGPVARALATWSHSAYAREELRARAPLRLPPAARVAQVDGTASAVARALDSARELALAPDAVLGPVPLAAEGPSDAGRVRALVRFDYARGAEVAAALRASVIAEAVSRRGARGRAAKATLSVKLDVLDPEL